MDRLGINNLPKWLHVLDDNTWINPISELLLISNLDPDVPYFLGTIQTLYLTILVFCNR